MERKAKKARKKEIGLAPVECFEGCFYAHVRIEGDTYDNEVGAKGLGGRVKPAFLGCSKDIFVI